jgi:hypothetical protein
VTGPVVAAVQMLIEEGGGTATAKRDSEAPSPPKPGGPHKARQREGVTGHITAGRGCCWAWTFFRTLRPLKDNALGQLVIFEDDIKFVKRTKLWLPRPPGDAVLCYFGFTYPHSE